MTSRYTHAWDTLYEIQQVAQSGNWVTFDTETTGLQGQIISWAVCASDGSVLGSGYVKPTVPIEPGARAIHGITDEQLADAPGFADVLPTLWRLLEHRTVIIYNASFDLSRFDESLMSIYAYPAEYDAYCEQSRRLAVIWQEAHCAMEWFAAIYGERHPYYGSFTWQKLTTACAYFAISHDQIHEAAADARATALLMQKMVALAEKELPPGYHPPRDEPCTGGCGLTLGPFDYDEDPTWYCAECGLTAGLNRLCFLCEQEGKRTIVSAPMGLMPVPEGVLCFAHEYKTKIASGEWHICPYCTSLVKAPLAKQKRCEECKRKHRSKPLTGPYEVPLYVHQLVKHEDKSVECRVCKQVWKHGPGVGCPRIPVYPYEQLPSHLKTFSQLAREHKQPRDRAQPDGAYRILKSPYYRFFYDEREALST